MSKKKAKKTTEIEGADVTVEIVEPIETGDEMNALAMRIWDGQSISLPLTERVKRIKARLTEKGYDTSTLTLPADDKYLE